MRWFFTENEANSSLTTDLTGELTGPSASCHAFNAFYGCIGRVTVTFPHYAGTCPCIIARIERFKARVG